MKLIRIHLVFLFCLLPSLAFAGTTYYVDATNGSDNNSGTSMNTAWKTISRVNKHSFATGDDVYFKCGDTWNGTQLDIDWSGSVNDRAIIGAYYNDGGTPIYGVSGARPIIDGNSWTIPSVESGLVDCDGNSGGYITIKDLYVKEAQYYGILIKKSGTNNLVENCYVYRSKKQGILITKSSYSTITKCTVYQPAYGSGQNGGGGITIIGGTIEDQAEYNTISYNVVHEGDECINVNRKATHTIIEYNVTWDCISSGIYLDATKTATVRYNIVYNTTDFGIKTAPTWNGIFIDNEKYYGYCFTGEHKIYGNLIAAVEDGIVIANQYQRDEDSGCTQDDNLIYNNTIVDSARYNIRIKNDGEGNWSGNEIKNNISLTLSSGSNHVYGDSVNGVTWSHNLYDDNNLKGNAGTDAVIGDPKLLKTSGWRSIPPDTVVGTEWSIQPGSAANDKGASINGYMERIYDYNFAAGQITVKKETDDPPDIGAWMIGAIAKPVPVATPSSPKSFMVKVK